MNEKLFGVTTNFDEDAYTIKLDRSAADFKERERKAQKIANEITGVSTSKLPHPKSGIMYSRYQAVTNNPHIAEERVVNVVDDSGINEEDKYVDSSRQQVQSAQCLFSQVWCCCSWNRRLRPAWRSQTQRAFCDIISHRAKDRYSQSICQCS